MDKETSKPETVIERKANSMTRATFERLQRELLQAEEDLSETQLAIGYAAGNNNDWHDNAAFDLANRDFDVHSSRVRRLKEALKAPQFIEPRTETSSIDIGNSILIRFDGDEEPESYTLLGPHDSGTSRQWISFLSPLGSNLIGKKTGEMAEYQVKDRTFQVTVVEIQPGDFT